MLISYLSYSFILKMEAAYSTKMLLGFSQTRECYIPEDRTHRYFVASEFELDVLVSEVQHAEPNVNMHHISTQCPPASCASDEQLAQSP
jgi:hypothetical protein